MRLQKVLASDLCSGCGLCASVLGTQRATMTLQGPGYLRPTLTGPVTAEEDQLLAEVCPGSQVLLPPAGPVAAQPEWGPLLSVQTGHATDEGLRRQSSSGGALSAILVHLLDSGEASYVLQVAASDEVPWLNQAVLSRGAAEIRHASGSRYAPSAPLEPIIQCLDRGERFVVVGKPCDIAALRAYGRHDQRVDQLVVAMIGFMCGGIPSAEGVKRLVSKMGADPDDVKAFRFRGNGWPGRATADTASGQQYSMSYNDSWGGVLSKHVQLRCKICADGNGMSADLVCADAWYGNAAGYPTFDEQEGRSLVLGRTLRGVALINAAVSSGRLATQPLAASEIDRMQPYQLRRTRLTLSRLLAMRLALRGATRYSGRSLWSFARNAGLKANVRSFLGTLARAVTGRL